MKTFRMIVMFPFNLVTVILFALVSPITIGHIYFKDGNKWNECGVTLKQVIDVHVRTAVKALRNEL